MRVTVLDCYAAFAVAALAEEVRDLKPVLLGHRDNPLPQLITLAVLFLDFQALDACLHLRQFGKRHAVEAVACSRHIYLPAWKLPVRELRILWFTKNCNQHEAQIVELSLPRP